MPALASPLDRFLRAVHRRHVFLRGMERTATGFLAGCAAALLVTPLLIWRDQSPVPPALAAILLGTLIGLLWGIVRRPTLLAAAAEADRQLRLADLLLTSLAARTSSDPWALAVIAMADARCRDLRPRQVVLNRFGTRAWSGVGLCGAMMSVLLLAGSPGEARAAGGGLNSGKAKLPQRDARRERPLLPAAPLATRRSIPAGRDNDAERPAPGAAPVPENGDSTTAGKAASPDGNVAPSAPAGGEAGGANAGAGETRIARPIPPPDQPGAVAGEDAPQPRPAGGTPSGGAGNATRPSENGAPGATGSTASVAGDGVTVPPWQGDGRAADARRAKDAVDSGQVPPAYRDIVRDYFDRR